MMTLKLMAAVAAMMIGTSNIDAKQNTYVEFENMPVAAANASATHIAKKMEYTQNRDGKVTSKTVYRWSAEAGCWVPSSRYEITYSRKGNTQTYSRWCVEDQCFKPLSKVAID